MKILGMFLKGRLKQIANLLCLLLVSFPVYADRWPASEKWLDYSLSYNSKEVKWLAASGEAVLFELLKEGSEQVLRARWRDSNGCDQSVNLVRHQLLIEPNRPTVGGFSDGSGITYSVHEYTTPDRFWTAKLHFDANRGWTVLKHGAYTNLIEESLKSAQEWAWSPMEKDPVQLSLNTLGYMLRAQGTRGVPTHYFSTGMVIPVTTEKSSRTTKKFVFARELVKEWKSLGVYPIIPYDMKCKNRCCVSKGKGFEDWFRVSKVCFSENKKRPQVNELVLVDSESRVKSDTNPQCGKPVPNLDFQVNTVDEFAPILAEYQKLRKKKVKKRLAKSSERCKKRATPMEFNENTAMEAIFCEYNRKKGATLIPTKYTSSWSAKEAEYLVTPFITATYYENKMKKGVIAIQRQFLDSNGEPEMSHATGATVSVYVFKYEGNRWVYEKGKKEALAAGTHGFAPGGQLVRLGKEKYGLWFEGGAVFQGYTFDTAYAILLSEENIIKAGDFDTGRSSGGEPHWRYEGHPEFIEEDSSEYYKLRIKYDGTEETDSADKIRKKNISACYKLENGAYVSSEKAQCAQNKPIQRSKIFGIAESEKTKKPIPSIPQKLVR